MTRDEIQDDLKTRDLDWLESRWSVLDEAIKAIEPHLAEVEAAFDYDYTGIDAETLEKSVCDQVLELCKVVTTHDTENTVSWGELLELLDLEIRRREKAAKCPSCSGRGHLPMQLKRGPDGKPKTCQDCKGTGENQAFVNECTVRKMDTGKVKSLVSKTS